MTMWFRRKPTKSPTVKTGIFTFVYSGRYDVWQFEYKDITFQVRGAELQVPDQNDLDMYVLWVASYSTHIEQAVKRLAEEWEGSVIDPSKAHVCSVEIESQNRIAVTVLGDETWGDIGYDMWIESGEIVNEGYAD